MQEAGPATAPIDPQDAVAGTELAKHLQAAQQPGYTPRALARAIARLTGQPNRRNSSSRWT